MAEAVEAEVKQSIHDSPNDIVNRESKAPPKRRAWLTADEQQAAMKFPQSAASARLLKQLADFNPSGKEDSAPNGSARSFDCALYQVFADIVAHTIFCFSRRCLSTILLSASPLDRLILPLLCSGAVLLPNEHEAKERGTSWRLQTDEAGSMMLGVRSPCDMSSTDYTMPPELAEGALHAMIEEVGAEKVDSNTAREGVSGDDSSLRSCTHVS